MTWIDVKEKMPTINEKSNNSDLLLLIDSYGDIFLGFCRKNETFDEDEPYEIAFEIKGRYGNTYYFEGKVTHWAELTPPQTK